MKYEHYQLNYLRRIVYCIQGLYNVYQDCTMCTMIRSSYFDYNILYLICFYIFITFKCCVLFVSDWTGTG